MHADFEELKSMSNQYNLVLSALKTQVERLSLPSEAQVAKDGLLTGQKDKAMEAKVKKEQDKKKKAD